MQIHVNDKWTKIVYLNLTPFKTMLSEIGTTILSPWIQNILQGVVEGDTLLLKTRLYSEVSTLKISAIKKMKYTNEMIVNSSISTYIIWSDHYLQAKPKLQLKKKLNTVVQLKNCPWNGFMIIFKGSETWLEA